jgi:hypothetical protein
MPHRNDLKGAGSLVRGGANVNATNRYGVPPLTLAATNGNAAMVELLLKAGANPNAAQAEGETVLMTAARTGIPAAVKALLAHGADVNAKESWRGQTALMWAAAEGHADTLQMLVEAGAQVNARSTAGWTALLFAAREGQIGAVKTLAGRRGRQRRAAGLRDAVMEPAPVVAEDGPRQAGRARSCWRSAADTSSWPRRCSASAPIPMRPHRAGRRSTTSRGFASRAPAATTPRPTGRAIWTA